jgi:hypothetical protein
MTEQPFIPTPHPVLKLPTQEQALAIGEEKLRELLIRREELIALERDDPYRHGIYLDTWRDADADFADALLLVLFGGNGSGKTYYMCRKAMETALTHANAKVLLLHEAEKPCILLHHATMWHYLPKELKVPNSKRQRVRKINYTVATGFSDGKFVLPNGSIVVFGAYKQDIADYEGTGWRLICADENLPLGWLTTLLYRLPRCRGQMLWGYTPIRGITPSVRHIVQGAITTESRPADPELLAPDRIHVEGCPPGHMPYRQAAVHAGVKVMYFPSASNPFAGYQEMKKVLRGRTSTEIEQRAYGYARNTVGNLFPKFSKVHVLDKARIEKVLAGAGTRRHYADPAGARNMFQIWTLTDQDDRRFVYREWPDVPTYGEWAVAAEDSRRFDGQAGPAQPALGYGVVDYKRIMLEAEGNRWSDGKWHMQGETIYERKFDPRSGKAGAMTDEHGGVSLMDMFLDEQRNEKGELTGPSMPFEQASGISQDQGIMAINDLLAWDACEQLCALVNEPKLYISETCQNLIWALQTYTGRDGEKAACKDPIDCLRYFATDQAEYIPPGSQNTRGGGSY